VRICTAKNPRGAYLCGLGAGWCVALVALSCGLETRRTAKNAAGRTAKPRRSATTARTAKRNSTWQRPNPRQRCGRTAMSSRTAKWKYARQRYEDTAKAFAVRMWLGARQRLRCRSRHCRALKAVAVRFGPFAVPGCRTAKLPFPVVR
jgi:hypothetical protein